jgi:RNA polymerase sigma factor (sigma-70 family)
MIRAASGGDAAARERFAALYEPAVRAYLMARWRGGAVRRQAVDDAVQDVFIELLREGGALGRVAGKSPGDLDRERDATSGSGGGFRAFLYGVARNIARRHEQNWARSRSSQPATAFLDAQPDDEARLSRLFDQAWARALLHEAGQLQRRRAESGETADPEALRRHDLLQLRFGEGLPIRDIAARWGEDAEHIHREYAKARREFLDALLEVMRFHHPEASAERLTAMARDLIGLLGAGA